MGSWKNPISIYKICIPKGKILYGLLSTSINTLKKYVKHLVPSPKSSNGKNYYNSQLWYYKWILEQIFLWNDLNINNKQGTFFHDKGLQLLFYQTWECTFRLVCNKI